MKALEKLRFALLIINLVISVVFAVLAFTDNLSGALGIVFSTLLIVSASALVAFFVFYVVKSKRL